MSYTFNDNDYSFGSDDYSFNGLEVLDQETTSSGGNDVALGQVGLGTYISQGITCGKAGAITRIGIQIKKVGSPAYTLYAGIWSNNSGEPDTLQSDETSLVASSLSTSYSWVEFEITSGPTVAVSDVVHVVIRCSAAGDASNYTPCDRNNSNPYAGGSINYGSDGSSWTNWASFDLLVRTYVS